MLRLRNISLVVLGSLIASGVWAVTLSIVPVRDVEFTPPSSQVQVQTPKLQPYGGCKEAWQAPRSEGARWCARHGLLPNDPYDRARDCLRRRPLDPAWCTKQGTVATH